MTTGIIILGMPRSGTSLLAQLVHAWGSSAGPADELLQADQWNTEGYFESIPFKRFNDRLLASVGATERVPPADEGPLRERAADPAYADEARELLARLQGAGGPWFVKDPRLPILLPFWTEIWRDVVYLVPVRNPLATIESQQKMARQVFPAMRAPLSGTLLYWQVFMLGIVKYAGARARLFVEYEQLVANPRDVCSRLVRFLADHVGGAGQPAEELARLVNPTLNRNAGGASLADTPLATDDQRRLYEHLRALVASPDAPLALADIAPYRGWHEYLELLDTMLQIELARLTGNVGNVGANWHDIVEPGA